MRSDLFASRRIYYLGIVQKTQKHPLSVLSLPSPDPSFSSPSSRLGSTPLNRRHSTWRTSPPPRPSSSASRRPVDERQRTISPNGLFDQQRERVPRDTDLESAASRARAPRRSDLESHNSSLERAISREGPSRERSRERVPRESNLERRSLARALKRVISREGPSREQFR